MDFRLFLDLGRQLGYSIQVTEIKILGRGGQGVVMAAQVLAKAFFLMGFYPQCYSLFGGERRGAPVKSFLRVDRERILLKCEIKKADHLIVMASDLLLEEPIKDHVKEGGLVLVNSKDPVFHDGTIKVVNLDAQKVARECGLGSVINTVMMGAYAKVSRELPLEYIERAIREYVPAKIEENLKAVRLGYERTVLP